MRVLTTVIKALQADVTTMQLTGGDFIWVFEQKFNM